jgi:hypothetical protein
MRLRSDAMTSWEDWGIVEATAWLRDNPDDGGDPETRRACEEIIKATRRRPAGPAPDPGGGRTKESPFLSEDRLPE